MDLGGQKVTQHTTIIIDQGIRTTIVHQIYSSGSRKTQKKVEEYLGGNDGEEPVTYHRQEIVRDTHGRRSSYTWRVEGLFPKDCIS